MQAEEKLELSLNNFLTHTVQMKQRQEVCMKVKVVVFLTHTVQMKQIIKWAPYSAMFFLLNPHGSDETEPLHFV